MLLRETLWIHDNSANERSWQARNVQQHCAHQCTTVESTGTGQQDGPTLPPSTHYHLQFSSLG